MRERFKSVYQRFPILLLLFCLISLSGCAAGNQEYAADRSSAQYRETGNSADVDISAFSFGENIGDAENVDDEGVLSLQFLDVGQGSAALVHQGDSWMLLDGGDREYSSYLVSILKEQGVTHLDYVVVSHYDSDHLSGIVGVLNTFSCAQVLAPEYEDDTRLYQSFLNVIKEKEIPVTYPRAGDVYEFADSSFRMVGPSSYGYDDPNSNSLCIQLEYGDNSFLLCGDCTEESEQDILYLGTDIDSDVFVANHHGSKYSNAPEFLKAVSPESVIISCGRENSYGHPHASVLLSVQKLGADLYRTDLQGTITATSDGETIRFEQEPCMDYRSGAEIEEQLPVEEQVSTEKPLPVEEQMSTEELLSQEATVQYVINRNSRKFHLPSCSSVADMEEKNKEYTTESPADLTEQGYSPCKRCNP